MTSFIIAGRDKQKRIDYAKTFCAKHSIDQFDIALIEKETSVKQNVQSIGIDEVKRIQKTIYLKPLKGDLKAIILEDAHLLTKEAQNALLKVLEEPPAHTFILLGTDSRESLLPTIQSRCQIILLEDEKIKMTTRELNDITEFVNEIDSMSVGEKLKRAESLAKDKDKAVLWIEKVITIMRGKLLNDVIMVSEAHPESLSEETIRDSGQARMTNCVRALQKLHTLLKETNVNPRFAIENTFLNL